jgi:hypothetical protein
MRIRTAALTGLMLAWATAVVAQPWVDAFDRQDYPTAAAQLQTIVFEHPQGTSRYPDPRAVQTLAQMYAEGKGVAKDQTTACALSNLGSGAAIYHYGERDPRTAAVQRQVDSFCVPLTADERRRIVEADGCFQQGPAPAVLLASETRRIEVSASRLTVTERGRLRQYGIRPLVRCAQQVPLVRYVRVAPPRGSKTSAREFVEIYSWHSTATAGQQVRTLEWSVVEVTPQTAVLRARTVVERGAGSTWPARPVPDAFLPGATFSMHKSGDVRWQLSSQLHGVIGRPAVLQASTAGPAR